MVRAASKALSRSPGVMLSNVTECTRKSMNTRIMINLRKQCSFAQGSSCVEVAGP
jgi:hypothetical protein